MTAKLVDPVLIVSCIIEQVVLGTDIERNRTTNEYFVWTSEFVKMRLFHFEILFKRCCT